MNGLGKEGFDREIRNVIFIEIERGLSASDEAKYV